MTKIFVAIPSVGVCDTRFAVSLAQLSKPPKTGIAAAPRSIPDAARNEMVNQASMYKFDYIFFLDDDMILDAMTLVAFKEILDSDSSIDVLSAIAFRRHPPFQPCCMKKTEKGYQPIDIDSADITPVDATHFAATMVRASIFTKIQKPYFEFKCAEGIVTGEDIVLSEKLVSAGAKLACHLGVEALHVGIPQLIGRKTYTMANRKESTLVIP